MPTNVTAASNDAEEILFEDSPEGVSSESEPIEGEFWRFPNETAGTGGFNNLYWDFPLPGGSHFGDKKWRVLYRSIQVCVELMFESSGHERGLRAGSVNNITTAMRFFVGWMAAFGYEDLSCMDATRFEEFMHWIKLTKCRDTDDGRKSVSVLHARCLLAFPAALFKYNNALAAAGLPKIPTVPYVGRNVLAVANEICSRTTEGYKAVPDDLFISSMNKVVEWLDCQVDEIQHTIDLYRMPHAPGFCAATEASRRRKLLAKLNFSQDKDTAQPWFGGFVFSAPMTGTRHYAHSKTRRGRQVELNAGHVIRQLLNAARDCCSIALQGTVGMRISEVCGLQVVQRKSKNDLWPSCVTVERSQSGMDDLFFISGIVFKGKEPPRLGRWLAGTRPYGSSDVPIPIRALIKLERLYAPWREMSGRNDLILEFSNRVGLAKQKERVFPVQSDRLRDGQKEWVKEYVQASQEFGGWELTSHQWRKAFARFCVRVDRTLLPAISRHFHHVSISTTEQHYAGEDQEIRYLIREAALELAAELLHDATRSQGLAAGGLMDEVPEVIDELSKHVNMADQDERLGFIHANMETDNIWGWDMLWCGCLFRPERAQCHLKSSVRKIIPIAPALDALGPFSSCNKCKNQIVLPRHRPFWEDRRKKLLMDRRINKSKGLTDVDFIISYRLAQCNEILKRIGRPIAS